MGWSCAQLAGLRMDVLSEYCVAETGSSNVFVHNGRKVFFEISRREHYNGAITGGIIEVATAKKVGQLRIESNGTISVGPKVLKDIPFLVMSIDGLNQAWRGAKPDSDKLREYIKKEYMMQFMPGGVNAHCGLKYPRNVVVWENDPMNVIAKWETALFEVW